MAHRRYPGKQLPFPANHICDVGIVCFSSENTARNLVNLGGLCPVKRQFLVVYLMVLSNVAETLFAAGI